LFLPLASPFRIEPVTNKQKNTILVLLLTIPSLPRAPAGAAVAVLDQEAGSFRPSTRNHVRDRGWLVEGRGLKKRAFSRIDHTAGESPRVISVTNF